MMMGADASFRLSPNNTRARLLRAHRRAPAPPAQASSYRARFDYAGDRYGLAGEHLMVGAGFAPEVGYTRRENFRRDTGTARFSPRLKSNRYMRKLTWQGTFTYDTDAERHARRKPVDRWQLRHRVPQRRHRRRSSTSTSTSCCRGTSASHRASPFRRAATTTRTAQRVVLRSANQRPGGRPCRGVARRLLRWHAARSVVFRPRRACCRSSRSSRASRWPGCACRTATSTRASSPAASPTRRRRGLFVSSLIQFNVDAHTLSSSVRFRWEYRPGSDLFLVYSDGRGTLGPGNDHAQSHDCGESDEARALLMRHR